MANYSRTRWHGGCSSGYYKKTTRSFVRRACRSARSARSRLGSSPPSCAGRPWQTPWPGRLPEPRGTYCSMAGDIVKGRTEIDNYTGHLLRLAGSRPCPLNRRVYDVFKRLEHRREVPGVAVLRELED